MKKIIFSTLIVGLICNSCTMKAEKTSMEKWKQEIVDTEQNFANLAKEEGLKKAFLTYAAEDAVLMRKNKLIVGKSDIEHYFNQPSDIKDVSLIWKPDFVDVSKSGDLGYTYGNYTFSYIDTTGNKIESTGIFHTVWKRDSNGNWKFVWD